MFSDAVIADMNQLARFLAYDQTTGHGPVGKPSLLILLGNAILPTAEAAFQALIQGSVSRLLIAGGIGHSTTLLYQAVQQHPRYQHIATDGRSEAEVLYDIGVQCFALSPEQLLLETASANCGDNALQARRVLEAAGDTHMQITLTQDPLMQLRTDASFRHVWRDRPEISFLNWPTFVPQLERDGESLRFAGRDNQSLWSLPRFASLLLGEIPRLRNAPGGYGPRGADFIAEVDIPAEIETIYARLRPVLEVNYGDRSF
ncbi:YdcF family protein [Prodigiosinella confusarubida]|uniref:YdcF family protein n=1 Tax=Serratia sp. (strain ATCC 39006) TaxID=104623 RepID=A0A2I5TIK5_SERS3|nr:YdcF family protein [Serratia sp. ATCC 39006]AUH00088.1 YdcF family protein [Serratia sp. ATCC 39006]AUH04407.1 YdcF family protein [Serratia sp. ATCC 39006]